MFFFTYLNMLKEFKYDIDFEKLIKIMIMNNISCTAQKSEQCNIFLSCSALYYNLCSTLHNINITKK